MSRKFRELIPLFAIALMIIGAVALLIAMNSKGKTKKIVNKEENKKTEVVEEQEVKEETEVSEPVAEIDVTEKDVTEEKIDEKTETKTSGTKSSVQKLVDTGLRTSNLGGTTTTETKKETSNVVINTAPSQTAVQQQPAKTQTTTTKPATTTTQKVVKPSYNVYKTVSGNGVKVQFAYGNKMIITSNGKEKVMDIGQVSKATIKNGNLYVELANGDTRSYSINGATLNIERDLNEELVGSVQTVSTNDYYYVLKDIGTVFIFEKIDGIINPAQKGILHGTAPVSEIVSANGKNITVKLTNGKQYTYVYTNDNSFDVK